jgi:hypothetical protein
MANKKKTAPTASTTSLPALTIGSRVRCTDDSVEGRIVWANATSVKIAWDDGEQVTWRRDSLPGRPVEILGPDAASQDTLQAQPPAATPAPEQATPDQPVQPEVPVMETATTATSSEPAAATESPAAETMPPVAAQTEATAPTTPSTDGEPAPAAPAKAKRRPKAASAPKGKKVSALDAAARVLQEAGVAMTCPEMIGAMAAKGYWISPGGKTPAATLYSALLREITTKGDASRFAKTGPGRFASRA